MPQICLTCQHPRRHQIEKDILKGISMVRISKRYEVSYDSIRYHSFHHLKPRLLERAKKNESEHLQYLIEWLEENLSTKPQLDYINLKKAAKELNKIMGLDPLIDLSGRPSELKDQIRKAVQLIEPGDEFSKKTKEVIKEFEQDQLPSRFISGAENVKVLVDGTEASEQFENLESISEPYAFDGIAWSDLPSTKKVKAEPDYIPDSNQISSESSDPVWLKKWRKDNRRGPLI